jgi:hypothetical protein
MAWTSTSTTTSPVKYSMRSGAPLLAKQARILELMLTRIADTAATVSTDPEPAQLRRLHAILQKTEQFLTTLAHQNIGIEHECATFQASGTHAWPLLPETAGRLRLLDQVNAIFHANLTAARRYLDRIGIFIFQLP